MKKISDKYNEACIKVFDMLKLLSNGTAKYRDIIELFNGSEKSDNAGANVILNKYLNTLKIFGINIYKSKNIYYLQNSIFSINLDNNDIKMLKKLKNASGILHNIKQKENFERFIKDIELRLTRAAKETLYSGSFEDADSINYEYVEKYKTLITRLENCCLENQKLELDFTLDYKNYKVLCEPKEIIYKNQKAYLSVFNHLSRQVFDVPIDAITEVKQLPVLSKIKETSATVVYKIKDDLAKSYQLKEWETCDGRFDEQGWLTIVNHNEDFDELLKRLMRYGSNCIVVSPKTFRESMIEAIDDTLKNYK